MLGEKHYYNCCSGDDIMGTSHFREPAWESKLVCQHISKMQYAPEIR